MWLNSLMLNDIFISGSSIASGFGKGKIEIKSTRFGDKSWVHYLAENSSARNVWNFSLSAKPIGLATKDTVDFVRQYGNKFGTYDKLFVIIEYTIPQYREWDPVAMSRNDTKENISVTPVSYFKQLNSNEDYIDASNMQLDDRKLILHDFYQRNTDTDMVALGDMSPPMYTPIDQNDIDQTFRDTHTAKAKEWFKYDLELDNGTLALSEQKMKLYFKYASDEMYSLKRYLEHFNIPYLMMWAGGQSKNFCRMTDRYFAELVSTNRLIPMTKFTCNKAAQEWSIKHLGSHPDDTGHQRIAEFVQQWIKEHKLYNKPNNTIYRGI